MATTETKPTRARPPPPVTRDSLSRERIRQIEQAAMRKFKIAMNQRGYKMEDLIDLMPRRLPADM